MLGDELPGPGSMSTSRVVPAGVPSVVHSSRPVAGCTADSSVIPAKSVIGAGNDEGAPGLMSASKDVPAGVPSLIQSSAPLTPSSGLDRT